MSDIKVEIKNSVDGLKLQNRDEEIGPQKMHVNKLARTQAKEGDVIVREMLKHRRK